MSSDALFAHLHSGTTTTCRAWVIERTDGTVFGFTDHDIDLTVDGVLCVADSGMTARALQQTTGLSVDNTEAVGALSSAAITEEDLMAGRFDRAEVRSYLVNWSAPEAFALQFSGHLGEVSRSDGQFRAELRGLTEALNQPHGAAYTSGCSAVLGDTRCRFDLTQPGYSAVVMVATVEDARKFTFSDIGNFEERWFEGGRFEVLSGRALGLSGVIKVDRREADIRRIELWQSLRASMAPGDEVRINAGCSKTSATCQAKFANFLNFRGFPHIPGEDWLAAYPVPGRSTGRARRFGGLLA